METSNSTHALTSHAPRAGTLRKKRSTRGAARQIAETALLAALYVLVARACLSLGATGRFAAPVWLPSGLALAVLLWRGIRLWPGVTLGAFVVNVVHGAPLVAGLAIAAGNTVAAALAFVVFRRLAADRMNLCTPQDVLGLLATALVAPLASATVGAATLAVFGIVPASVAPYTWYVWWTGDALGVLVTAPVLLTWIANPRRPRLEELLVYGAVLLSALIVFGEVLPDRVQGLVPISYLVFPSLIWAAVRFGPRSVATGVFVLSIVAVTSAVLGYGLFEGATLTDRLLLLQAFVAVVVVTSLLLSAAIAERKSRDQLIAAASHELRNAVNTLGLHCELLTESVKAGLPAQEIEAIAGAARRPIGRLAQLLDELLDVSRVTEGVIALERSECDLGAIVEEVADRLAPELEQRGSRVELHVEPAKGHWDRSRLDQLVTNLVSNASKYGGEEPISIRVTRRHDVARLVVEDRGPGVSRQDRRRIFDPFVRLGDPHRAAGTGLGLTIAREIVRAHEGRIWVESELGAGARFIVELPTAPGTIRSKQPRPF